MNKAQKRQIEDCVKTLQQAHEEIMAALGQGNYAVVGNMFGECQDFAVSLGENIEKLAGEGHATVACLEEYCEILFHIYEKINSGNVDEQKIDKLLKKQIAKLENSVEYDLQVKKQIVFLPYKASMWDSLESIYLAARKDENCDAYVVPIPYYDRNADGSFGQMHYEGTQFPKNIPITSWQDYSIEENEPDIIYIHNPYDHCNIVTSIHPAFYSSELKKHTKELIYVPYFVLQEIEPDDQEAIDNMKHFIWLPGVVYADKVILQSEKMKQIYINEYIKAAKAGGMPEEHQNRRYLEQKFLGTGSPKFDKVLNTKKEDLEIPDEWMRVIRKPDGSWKKIIFYNIGISALLENGEKWVDKIENSLSVFKENQEEVALLWRPHPLIENTMKSMRPVVMQRYLEIKNRYRQEGWGIFDDTADMDRAVILSDAYYGDGSSVIQLYQKTGKPIMRQKVEILY